MKKFGRDAPSLNELGLGRYEAGLPAHVKHLRGIKQEKLLQLAMSTSTKKRLIEVFKYLNDPQMYGDVKKTRTKPSRLSKKLVTRLLGLNYVTECNEMKGSTHIFLTPELAKRRMRVIKHTVDINDAMPSPKVTLPTPLEIERLVRSHKCVGAVDFAAYFDQFHLSDEVQKYYAFTCNHKNYQATRLAMGTRVAVAIAQAASEAIADVQEHECSVAVYIDNVFVFANDTETCKRVLRRIVKRAHTVGAIVNEVTDPDSTNSDETPLRHLPTAARNAKVNSLVSEGEAEILGRLFDMKKKTVCIGPKSLAKLEALADAFRTRAKGTPRRWRCRGRDYCAYVSLLTYASGILRLNPAKYASLFKRLLTIQRLQAWNEKQELAESEIQLLELWLQEAIRNRPRSLNSRQGFPRVIVTDACGKGWGGALYHHGLVTVASGLWEEHIPASVESEPLGLVMAVQALVAPATKGTILIGTDSVKVTSVVRRMATAPEYWGARLAELQPDVRFEAFHVPGQVNPLDGVSRGRRFDEEAFTRTVGELHTMARDTGNGDRATFTQSDRSPEKPCMMSLREESSEVSAESFVSAKEKTRGKEMAR